MPPFRLIAPKLQGVPQELLQDLPQEPSQEHLQELFEQNSDVIAVATLASPQPAIAKPSTAATTAKVSKKNDGKTEKTGSADDETGWDDINTGLLLSFLEDNFVIYKKNKSSFAKLVVTKVFTGKSWEQIKNKLARLVTKYNEIKAKEGQTGREAQAKWKWFERLDALFGTRENHNPGFLVDGFSDNIQLFDYVNKENEIREECPIETEKKDDQTTKKRKFSQDPLAETIVSMGNIRQTIWEKRIALESEQFEKKQEFEKEVREAEVSCRKQELEIERIKAETLQKKNGI